MNEKGSMRNISVCVCVYVDVDDAKIYDEKQNKTKQNKTDTDDGGQHLKFSNIFFY